MALWHLQYQEPGKCSPKLKAVVINVSIIMLMWGYFNACRKRIVSYAVLYFSESLAVTIWSRDAPNHTSQLFTANTYLTFKKGDSADICQSRSTYLLSYVYLSYCVCFMDVFILFLVYIRDCWWYSYKTSGFHTSSTALNFPLMSWDVTQSLLSARELFPPLS